ncbi:LysR family transcriptional regulator [Sodalis sp. (in: enterobacteria)]|uniref:LysR family transcriptional regulator n=1 Tax=Sodalis sp. (in: enterobacteria) TaxID=1898979 RepID=UPI003F6883C4
MCLDDLRVFVQTAAAGSFSLAARQLDITPAYASGAVMRLERAIGTRLFVRNARHLRLSEAGERYLPHARAALDAMAQGQQALALRQDEIAGPLRLSAPSDFSRRMLLLWLDEFQQRYPRVSV